MIGGGPNPGAYSPGAVSGQERQTPEGDYGAGLTMVTSTGTYPAMMGMEPMDLSERLVGGYSMVTSEAMPPPPPPPTAHAVSHEALLLTPLSSSHASMLQLNAYGHAPSLVSLAPAQSLLGLAGDVQGLYPMDSGIHTVSVPATSSSLDAGALAPALSMHSPHTLQQVYSQMAPTAHYVPPPSQPHTNGHAGEDHRHSTNASANTSPAPVTMDSQSTTENSYEQSPGNGDKPPAPTLPQKRVSPAPVSHSAPGSPSKPSASPATLASPAAP